MEKKAQRFTSGKTLLFIVVLCFVCALILSTLNHLLRTPQRDARELYKSKQLLRSAAILSDENVFLLDGVFATYDETSSSLIPTPNKKNANHQSSGLQFLGQRHELR